MIGISCIANQLLVLVMLLFDLNPQLRVPVVSPGSRTLIMMDGGVFLRDFSCFQLIVWTRKNQRPAIMCDLRVSTASIICFCGTMKWPGKKSDY